MIVERLPLTVSGKVDRAALAVLTLELATSEADSDPLTDAEQLVAEVWAEVLGWSSCGLMTISFISAATR